MNTKKLEPHPLCLVLPEMTPAEFQQLVDSIKSEGQHDAIVTYQGQILEGRHRYNACLNLGIEPVMEEYDELIHGKSPTQYVMAKNVFRRHLSVSQRAVIATEIIPHFEAEAKARKEAVAAKPPTEETPAELPPTPSQLAAAAVGVSESTVRRANKVKEKNPEGFEQIKKGEASIRGAAQAIPSTTIEAEFQRKAALDQLTKDHGESFAKSVLSGDLLAKGKDFEDFMTLDAETQASIVPLIIERWTTKKAVAFLGNEPTLEDPIKKLILKHNVGKKKKSTFAIGSFSITVQQREQPAASDPPAEQGEAPATTSVAA